MTDRTAATRPSDVPPGWYHDPHGTLRWWDGSTWTAYSVPSPPPPASTAWTPRAVLTFVAGFVGANALLSILAMVVVTGVTGTHTDAQAQATGQLLLLPGIVVGVLAGRALVRQSGRR